MKSTLAIGAGLTLIHREAGLRYLWSHLRSLPGLPMKASQLLRLIHPDCKGLDESIDCELPYEPLSVHEVERMISKQSPLLAKSLTSLEPAFEVGSIAQVHRAQLKGGERVIVKIQQPDLQKVLKDQVFELVKWMGLSPARKYGFDAEMYRTQLLESLGSELDSRREASNQDFFFNRAKEVDFLTVPRCYLDLSTDTILVQEEVLGESLESICQKNDSSTRREVSRNLSQFLETNWCRWSFIHGDLHPKNWAVGHAGPLRNRLIVYDYGLCLELSPSQRRGIELLVSSFSQNSVDPFLRGMSLLGFQIGDWSKEAKIVQKWLFAHLNQLEFSFCKSSKTDEEAEVRQTKLDADLAWKFRLSAPAWMFPVQRSFFYLKDAKRKLSEGIEVSPTGEQNLEIARNLRIEISDRLTGAKTVELEFPAESARRLAELLPESVQQTLQTQGKSIEEIQSNLDRKGLIAQTLFEESTDRRSLKVWLS